MQHWLNKLDKILDMLALNPPNPLEKWMIISVAALLMIFIFGLVASMIRVPNTDPARTTVIVVFGTIAMMLAAVAAEEYLSPRVGGTLGRWVPLAAAVVSFFAIAVPFACLWQRSKYLETTITWIAGLVAAAIAIFLVASVFDAIATGNKQTSRAKSRNKEIEKEFFGR